MFLRLRKIAAAATSLDVRDRKLAARRQQRSRKSRIRVAVDDDPIGLLRAENWFHAGEHTGQLRAMRTGTDTEVVPGRGDIHLVKEQGGDFVIVMLAGLNDLMVDFVAGALAIVFGNGAADGAELHEMRTRSNNADPFCLWMRGTMASDTTIRFRPIFGAQQADLQNDERLLSTGDRKTFC